MQKSSAVSIKMWGGLLCAMRGYQERSQNTPHHGTHFIFFAIFHKEKRVVRNNKIEGCMKNQNNFSFYRIII